MITPVNSRHFQLAPKTVIIDEMLLLYQRKQYFYTISSARKDLAEIYIKTNERKQCFYIIWSVRTDLADQYIKTNP